LLDVYIIVCDIYLQVNEWYGLADLNNALSILQGSCSRKGVYKGSHFCYDILCNII